MFLLKNINFLPNESSPISWGFRIRGRNLCKGVRKTLHTSTNVFLWHETIWSWSSSFRVWGMWSCCRAMATITASEDTSLEKYASHFIERVVCERELETEQNCNTLTPTLMAISFSFPFSCAAQPEARGAQLTTVCCFLYSIISPSLLIPKLLEFPVHWVI